MLPPTPVDMRGPPATLLSSTEFCTAPGDVRRDAACSMQLQNRHETLLSAVRLTVITMVPDVELMAPPDTVATLPVSWLESTYTIADGRAGPEVVLKVSIPKLMAPPDCTKTCSWM